MIKDILKDAETRMHSAVTVLHDNLSSVRTGRASPSLVEKLQVEYYGQPTSLMQLATISVPEPRSLLIKPFDATIIKDIEKAITNSDLKLNPNSDGKVIHLNLPPLNEERRRELVKHVHHRVEESRVAIRNIRRDVIKDMKDYESEKLITEDELKRGEAEVEKLVERIMGEVDKQVKQKEHEIMEV